MKWNHEMSPIFPQMSPTFHHVNPMFYQKIHKNTFFYPQCPLLHKKTYVISKNLCDMTRSFL